MPGSSPSMTTRLVFAHKGVEFDRVDLVARVHKSGLRRLGFEGGTVPALTLDGRRIRRVRISVESQGTAQEGDGGHDDHAATG